MCGLYGPTTQGGFMTFKRTLVLALIAFTANAMAAHVALDSQYDETKFYTISKVEVSELSHDVILDQSVQKTVSEAYLDQAGPTRLETAGKVISTARDLVALGEDIYRLVSKGKPNVTTAYDPISVIPKVNGQPVDLLDTETWSMPTKRTYSLILRNTYNIAVITFRYSVMYSYRGSYNGKGAYLTAAQIQPEYVNVLWGFDFSATMKLAGIQNQGSRDNPVAAATLLMQYTASNVLNSRTMVDTFFITGRGGFKKL
jgi:hypothetical protein